MVDITLICGLPGSGKTHLAHVLAQRGGSGFCVYDDMLCVPVLPTGMSHLLFTHPRLVFSTMRARLQTHLLHLEPSAQITWVFFENNPEAALRNVAHRADGRAVEGFIRGASRQYVIPDGHVGLPIWQPPSP